MSGSQPPLDLTGEPAGAVVTIAGAPYDPARERERVRGWIATALIVLQIGLITVLFVCILVGVVRIPDLDKIVATILTPIMGIVGTVIGFYFGETSK